MAYDNEMKGVLFKNERKENDAHPDTKGQAIINGKKYWISGWTKEHNERGRYIRLSFQEAEQRGGNNRSSNQQRTEQRSQQRQRQPDPEPEYDDDIPF